MSSKWEAVHAEINRRRADVDAAYQQGREARAAALSDDLANEREAVRQKRAVKARAKRVDWVVWLPVLYDAAQRGLAPDQVAADISATGCEVSAYAVGEAMRRYGIRRQKGGQAS